MKYIIDIETGPLPAAEIEHLAPKFSAPSNFKDAEKIAANIAEQKANWLDRSALSPLTGKIVALGVRDEDGTTRIYSDSEAGILEAFWGLYGTNEFHQFIGHNIHGFDLPFIVRRSWLHGIPVPSTVFEPGGRYINGRRFIDTMKVFQCGNYKEDFISLDRLSKWLGLGGKTEESGKHFAQLLIEDRERALAYLTKDLELTAAVASRLGVR